MQIILKQLYSFEYSYWIEQIFKEIYLIQAGAITSDQHGPGSNDNEGVCHTPQSSRVKTVNSQSRHKDTDWLIFEKSEFKKGEEKINRYNYESIWGACFGKRR